MINLLSNKKKAINKALECQGWTSKEKLSKLYDLVKETESLKGDIIEIGSAWGRSLVLLGYASRKKIWSIDPHTGGLAYLQQGTLQDSFSEFQENLKKNGLLSRVEILKHTTDEVITRDLIPKTVKFSFAFVDGLHTQEGVLKDFELLQKFMLPDSVIVFDDYFEPGVKDYTKSIDFLANSNHLTLMKSPDSKLAYIRMA